jgi:hypothetical protein
VEAYREAQVRAALAGIPDVYYWKPDAIKLVPLGQMTSVVAVRSERAAFAKGQFVRLLRGHYKGDLAQVRAARDREGRAGPTSITAADGPLPLPLHSPSPTAHR